MNDQNTKNIAHNITILGREILDISGVLEVISFDESNVVLSTALGEMEIYGIGLHVKNLSIDKGQISVEGKVNGIQYFDTQEPKKVNLFGKNK